MSFRTVNRNLSASETNAEPDSAYTGICVFIGPEGGFSREEVAPRRFGRLYSGDIMKAHFTYGDRAGLTVMASIRYEFDD